MLVTAHDCPADVEHARDGNGVVDKKPRFETPNSQPAEDKGHARLPRLLGLAGSSSAAIASLPVDRRRASGTFIVVYLGGAQLGTQRQRATPTDSTFCSGEQEPQ